MHGTMSVFSHVSVWHAQEQIYYPCHDRTFNIQDALYAYGLSV